MLYFVSSIKIQNILLHKFVANVIASSYYNIAKVYELKSKFNNALNYYKLAKQYKQNPVYDKAISRVSARIE